MTLQATTSASLGVTWHEVCRLKALVPERGATALVAGTTVAVFRLEDDRVFALQHTDPFSGAASMSRCIVGRRGDVPTITSPMYRKTFDLRTGSCLDQVEDESGSLQTYAVHVVDGVVALGIPGTDGIRGTNGVPEPPDG